MIIIRLRGGLGNQMFQYAAGHRLASHNKTKLKFDLSWLTIAQEQHEIARRQYSLDAFEINASFANSLDLNRVYMPPYTRKKHLYRVLMGSIQPFYEPEDGSFQPDLLEAPKNSYLEGNWLNEKYFKDQAISIRSDFRFNKLPGHNTDKLKTEIYNSEAVSVHIRRGDYVTNKIAEQRLGILPLDYYKNAAEFIGKKINKPAFFVFSDDIEWCKKHLNLESPTFYSDPQNKNWEDMWLMSLCKHNVIANSSFSWWGGWLNNSPNKIIVAPKKWFKDTSIDSSGLLLDEWVKL